jgi:hypothetical protein
LLFDVVIAFELCRRDLNWCDAEQRKWINDHAGIGQLGRYRGGNDVLLPDEGADVVWINVRCRTFVHDGRDADGDHNGRDKRGQ